jgi:hypothetical protein
MTAALRIHRQNGVVFVPAPVDAAFRKALLDGVPASLHPKMKEALAATPHRGSRAHAQRYFGDEANEVFVHAATFAQDLHRFLAQRFGLEGLLDWLTATGYGNDYRMIKVFAEWARLSDELSKKQIIIPNG